MNFLKKIYPLKKTFIFSTKSMMLLFYLFSIFSFVLAMLYFCLKYMFVILCLRKLLNLFANQKHFPSLTPPQRSMRIDYVPQLETFLFQVPSTNQVDALVFYWKITSWASQKRSFICVTDFYGRTEFWKLFVS